MERESVREGERERQTRKELGRLMVRNGDRTEKRTRGLEEEGGRD